MLKTKTVYLMLITAFIAAGCGAGAVSSEAELMPPTEKAQDFTLADPNGKDVSLSSSEGKEVVLLDFSTTWCPHCITLIPRLKELHSRYHAKGLKVIAVYVNESVADVSRLTRKYSVPYTVVVDGDGAVASRYGVRGVPTVLVIDRDGMVRYRGYDAPESIIGRLLE
jgi:peroxiredoxin